MAELQTAGEMDAVLFDLDGTLADSVATVAEAAAASARAFGHELEEAQFVAAIGPSMVELYVSLLGVSEEEAEAMYADYLPRYAAEFIPRTPPLPGAGELLTALRERGVRLAIVTNKMEAGGRALVEALGWTSHFEVIVGRDTAPRAKPAPDPALHALACLSAEAERSVYVGDTVTDMECARAAKIATVIALGAGRDAAVLGASGATHVCADLAAVGALLLA